MKRISFVLIVLCVIGCHHNQTKAPDSSGRVWLSPSNEYVDTARSSQLAQEADPDTIDWDAEVEVTRDWYPESRIVHPFGEFDSVTLFCFSYRNKQICKCIETVC